MPWGLNFLIEMTSPVDYKTGFVIRSKIKNLAIFCYKTAKKFDPLLAPLLLLPHPCMAKMRKSQILFLELISCHQSFFLTKSKSQVFYNCTAAS